MPHSRGTQLTAAPKLVMCVLASAAVSSATAGESPEGFTVTGTRFLGPVWNQGHAEASIVAQDGGYSYPVPGGTLWWFGDTFRGSRDADGKPQFAGGGVSCSVAFLEEANKAVPPVVNYLRGEDGTVAQAIGFLDGESWDHHRIWPLGGICVNGKSYVYYSLIELVEDGGWGFRPAGSGLAWSAKPLAIHTRIQSPDGWRFPVSPTATLVKDGWVYLYDVEKRKHRQGIWLSRVRPEEIEDPQRYEFYCKPGPVFSADKNQQVRLLDNIYGQASLAWNEYLGKYVLASSSDLFRPREIRFHTADEPFGPWSGAVARVTIPERLQGKKVKLVYCTFLHPALFREKGRVMNMTFSLHLEEGGFDVNNEMVEVEVEPGPE